MFLFWVETITIEETCYLILKEGSFMSKKSRPSCTTILVGKKATVDGSTIIARNEDAGVPINAKKFVVIEPDQQPKHYKSVLTSLEIDLPDNPLRYTSTPDAVNKVGVWGESGINSDNVAMSSTETITTNSRVLGVDPFVKEGISEEDMLTITLPYIHSAKEGAQRLGSLLEKYGTYETNAIAFSDKDNIWYFESIAGHQWAAVRIPDDAYVAAPNRLNIDSFDFDSENTLSSPDLKNIIETYHLNPDKNGLNLRHTVGSSTYKDTRYNNPRAWYIQKLFNPSTEQDPIDQDLPFICHAEKKLSVEDVKVALSSHYQSTPYDVYGKGAPEDKKYFRPIGINRNQECHILQIRNDVPEKIAAIHWLAFGPNTFNAVVPFYANINDTPKAYKDTKDDLSLDSVYWLSRIAGLLGDYNFNLYSDKEDTFEQNTVAECRHLQIQADKEYKNQKDVSTFLENTNEKMAEVYMKNATKLLDDMVKLGTPNMKLKFTLND